MFLSVCGSGGGAENQTMNYGEQISYTSGNELRFPDFSIKFLGRRDEKISKDILLPLTMTFYDFEVSKGDTAKKISWSSGTGDIGPSFFEIGGDEYVLEMSHSDVLKKIEEGRLVVWKKSVYEESKGKSGR